MKEQFQSILKQDIPKQQMMIQIINKAVEYYGEDHCCKGGECVYIPDGIFEGCFVGMFLTDKEAEYYENEFLDEEGDKTTPLAQDVYKHLPNTHILKTLPSEFWRKGQIWHDKEGEIREIAFNFLIDYVQEYQEPVT